MKKRILVIGISVICIGLFLYFSEIGNIRYSKTLRFKEFAINYDQYLRGHRKFSEGHYLSNELLFIQANRVLALQLCKKYQNSKDNILGNKIVSMANEFGTVKEKNIDSILIKADAIFDTNLGIE